MRTFPPPGAGETLEPVADVAGAPGLLEQRYEPREPIASGGSAEVIAAWDGRLRREVALKLLRSDLPGARARFLGESQVTAQLEHPNIIPVHDAGVTADGRVYLAMKRVRGESLTTWMREEPRPLAMRLDLFRKVCDAVAFAHSRGVIHRDLKPDNVMVGSFGEVFVADWGLARPIGGLEDTLDVDRFSDSAQRTREGQIAGTPAYMSPEQAAGRLGELDERSDVYGLGAVLWELLVGRPPLEGGVYEVLAAVAKGLPAPRSVRPTVPEELDAVVRRATALRPADRYPSVRALRADIDAYLEHQPLPGVPTSARVRVVKWAERHRGPLAAAASVAGLALLAGLGLTIGYALNLRSANSRVEQEALHASKAEAAARRSLVEARIALSDALAGQGRSSEAAEALSAVRDAAAEWPELALALALVEAQRAGEAPPPIATCTFAEAGVAASDVAFSPAGDRLAAVATNGELREWRVPDCAVISERSLGKVSAAALRYGEAGLEGVVLAGGQLRRLDEASGVRVEKGHVVGWDAEGIWVGIGREVYRRVGDTLVAHPWTPPDGEGYWVPDGEARLTTNLRAGSERAAAFDRNGSERWGELGVWSRDLSPDGTTLLAGGPGGLRAVDFRTGAVRWDFVGEPVQRLLVEPESRLLVEAGYGGRLRIRNLTDGTVLFTAGSPKRENTSSLAATAGARLVAVGGGWGVDLYLRPESSRRDPNPAGAVSHGLAVSPNGAMFAVADESGRVRVLDTLTRAELRRFQPQRDGVRQLEFSRDGRQIAAALRLGGVAVLDVASGEVVLRAPLPVRTVSVGWGEGHLNTVDTEGGLWRVPLAGGAPEAVRQVLPSATWELTTLPSGEMVVASHIAQHRTIRLLDRNGSEVAAREASDTVYHTAARGDLLGFAQHDGTALIWNRKLGTALSIVADTGPVMGIDFSPDGSLLATTGFGGAVRLWSLPTGREVRSIAERVSPGTDVQFLPDGSGLVSIGLDGFAVFELSSLATRRAQLAQLSGPEPAASRAAAALGWWERVSREGDALSKARAALVRGEAGAADAVVAAALN